MENNKLNQLEHAIGAKRRRHLLAVTLACIICVAAVLPLRALHADTLSGVALVCGLAGFFSVLVNLIADRTDEWHL